jgi:hypothetical protein
MSPRIYNVVRIVHLTTGLLLLVFFLMYFITGLPLIHEKWFPESEARTVTTTNSIAFAGGPDSAEFVPYLEKMFDLRGRRGDAKKQKDGSWKFTWFRPGTESRVVLGVDGKMATVTKIEYGPRRVLVGLHRLHGYGGGFLYDVWAVLMDASSCAAILFPLTGIVLWYKSTPQKTLGWCCLALGFGLTALMIWHLMHR